ncbi:MAG: VIT domain-containing protein [Phycisphaerae bacterium]|jgi:Ca-activated chloride channel family protein
MTRKERSGVWVAVLVLAGGLATPVLAQSALSGGRRASNVVMPQSRAFPMEGDEAIEITAVDVGVVIIEQVATTTMDISLRNRSGRDTDAELLVPVPDRAAVRGFTFQGSGAAPTAVVLPQEEAKQTYDEIVARIKDPALLEFAGFNLVRSSVFPVPARGTQKVRLTYEHVLPRDGSRVDYYLPRSESLALAVPWNVSVRIESKQPISTVYSPSHEVFTVRSAANVVSIRVKEPATTMPGPFRLSYLIAQEGVTASLLAYPDAAGDGGYFLLLAGLPADLVEDDPPVRQLREVTLVLDRSGSMRGEKMDQAREAAMQVIAGLRPDEYFNIIDYNSTVSRFSQRAVRKDARTEGLAMEYLQALRPGGGTNIYEALQAALQSPQTGNLLPIVLFLTDGLPTVGETSEVAIRELATKVNPCQRRVFTFGVGVDVNTPLLTSLAQNSRAMSTFVLPGENVEVKVAEVFGELEGPVLAGPTLEVVDEHARPAPGRICDMLPTTLPDLYAGDQLVVLGRYVGGQPLHFYLRGQYFNRPKAFKLNFTLDRASTRNAFVPRLWASRRIATLVDDIRAKGADPATLRPDTIRDPGLKELVDEIVQLSTEYGVLTEYTAFLAREGTDLTKRDEVMAEAQKNLGGRAMAVRSGMGSVNQSMNLNRQRGQSVLNSRNSFLDENMNSVSESAVQQMNDRAFFRRGGRWVDSRVVSAASQKPEREVVFGSPEFAQLLARLVAEGRQGCVALDGEILLKVGDELVLVKEPQGS